MAGVFVCYRRADSQDIVGRICDRLAKDMPALPVLRDVDAIAPGEDFSRALTEMLQRSTVAIIVIGRQWLSLADGGGRQRLDDPADIVRREIETLLSLDIPIIPCLTAGAEMPREKDVPQSIAALTLRQALSVRPDPDFHRDMDRMISRVAELEPSLRQIPTAELLLVRQPQGWWSRMHWNNWTVFIDDVPVIELQREETQAKATVPAGRHRVHATWYERQEGVLDRNGTTPGYTSDGKTEELSVDLSIGRHVFTLRACGDDPRGWWSKFFQGYVDARPRALSRVRFEPADWPMADSYL